MRGRLFVLLQRLLPKVLITRSAGGLARANWRPLHRLLIRLFIRRYGVDMSEAARSESGEFSSFNDFFTRELKPGIRPLEGGSHICISPADGTLSQFGPIADDRLIQAKGINYSLRALVADDAALMSAYRDGAFATVYLSPRDYHRVHMPLTGKLRRSIYVPGRLFSVNAATTAHLPGLFTRNERWIGDFEGERFPFTVILVGALVVASIRLAWTGELVRHREIARREFGADDTVRLARGAELARFELGSTVILLVPKGAMKWAPGLACGDSLKMGQQLAQSTPQQVSG